MEFNLDDLTKLLALLVAVSVAAERLVEILKTFIFKNLSKVLTDPDQEARRQVKVQVLALVASLLTALLLRTVGTLAMSWGATLALGFLASGGSSLWNSLLGWAKGLKDIRQTQGEQVRQADQAGARIVPPELPRQVAGG